jgi:hypothetical protein
MTRHSVLIGGAAVLLAGVVLVSNGAESSGVSGDAQLRAMTDELARSKTLQLNNLDKPYFIEYTIGDSEQVAIATSLGGLLSSSRLRLRSPRIEVRVGDYKFDNTNSIYSGSQRLGLLPIDDDYPALRNQLWLSTDALYKSSADQITRKRNALREIGDPDKTPDLAPAKVANIIQPPGKLSIDQKSWETTLRRLSAIFSTHPGVIESELRLRAISSTYRLANTEGTVVRIPQELSEIAVRTVAVAPDGSRVWNHWFFAVDQPAHFPAAETLGRAVSAVASETEALAKAPASEDYSGPVLFEQEAAAQMMASVMSDALRLHRKPLAPPGGESARQLESVWSARVGSRVVPEWLTIYDDPLQEQFKGTTLAGHYLVDDEGVPAERVSLIDNGTLKAFLASRLPVREYNASNGHGRLPGGFSSEEAVIGNLFVQAKQTVREAQMKAKLLEKAKAGGLKYGILIRRLDFPSTASVEELQSLLRQLQKGGHARTLNPPLLAYRVYLDGREELIRGVRFGDFSAKELRDVAAASDQPYVLNYVNNGSSFNYAEGAADATTSSVVCPSLLFDSIDLAHAENEPGKPPIVPPPALIAQ